MHTTVSKSEPSSIEDLARLQGIQPVEDLEEWLAQLPHSPEETTQDTEDIVAMILYLRRELRQQEDGK